MINRNKMIDGPIFKTLVAFSLPLILMNIIQLLFHTADVAVLGIMASDAAVAAVGACGSIISMMLCVFSGYSSASNVIIAKRIGAQDVEGARRATGAALVMGVISGVILMLIALIFARDILILTNCQPEILDEATLYMQIYFSGMPIIMLYNFIAAILRASGDSLSPTIYMIISGIVNVVLNIVFVGAFNLSVAGVALATLASNAVALVLAIIKLAHNKEYCKVELKNLRIRKDELKEIVRIGLPICIGAVAFYLGEVIMTSAVNSISENAMTANTLASQIDRMVYQVGASIALSTGIMLSQNIGAKNSERIGKIMWVGSFYTMGATLSLGILMVLVSEFIFGLMTDTPEVISLAMQRSVFVCLTNFITCEMEVFSNAVRATKRTTSIVFVGLICGFAIRSSWSLLLWPVVGSFTFLFVCLPLSTFIGTFIYAFVYSKEIKKIKLEFAKESLTVGAEA